MGVTRVLGLLWAAALAAACGSERDTVPEPEPSCEVSIDCSGSLCPTVVYASDGKVGSDLAALDVEGGFVYFQRPGGSVWRVPVDGGEAERLVAWSGQSGGALYAAEEGAYYVIDGTLTFLPGDWQRFPIGLAGGMEAPPATIAADAENVYALGFTGPVLLVSRQSLGVSAVPGTAEVGGGVLSVDDVEVYVDARPGLIAISKATGEARVVVPADGAQRIALSGDRIYWSPNGLQIKSALKDGSDVRTEVDHRVSELVVVGEAVYWFSDRDFGVGATVLFHTAGFPRSLVFDGGSLWWLDGAGWDGPCAVLRLELPPP